MGRVNWGRVLLGGLVAGLVINVSEYVLNVIVLADEYAAEMRRLNLDPEAASIPVWILYAFLVGIVAVFVYAAIRPRFGAGPRTALLAGFLVWILLSLFPTVAVMNMGMFSTNLMLIGLAWALVELLVATLIGASLYREEPV